MLLKNEIQKMIESKHECVQTGPGLVANNFRKISQNGFGDPENAYPHSMAWFRDKLYVGTTRSCFASRGIQRREDCPDRIGEVWPVRIPETRWDMDLRAQIWCFNPLTHEWNKLFTAPTIRRMDKQSGEDRLFPLSLGFRAIVTFQGTNDSSPALYIPTAASSVSNMVMLRSVDGVNFEIVSEEGAGFPDAYKTRGIRALINFKGRLFSSPIAGQKGQRKMYNYGASLMILETDRPAGGKWRVACEPYFGDPNNLSVYQMAGFNGYLYAGTLNVNEGFQVWKTAAEGSPPYKWKRIITQGAYRGRTNQIAITMRSFKNHLYVGSAIQDGGYDVPNKVGPAAVEIIRINPDDSWDLVVGESRSTPEGLKVSLSGLRAGFGSFFAGYIWSMCEHEGHLYVGTADWLCSLRYSNYKNWPEKLRKTLPPKLIEELIHKFGGFDLWRSKDGCRWTSVSRNGFENYYNIGIRNMVSTPHGLFVGAVNAFAPDVAVKRVAGWNYEPNPRGGLEIWLGSSNSRSNGSAELCNDDSTNSLARLDKAVNENEKSGLEVIDSIINQFYGGCSFQNVGFWNVGVPNAKIACENLIDEILAFIPEKKGALLEIGCGLGATTQYLSKYFSPESITAITNDKKDLQNCRKTAPGVKFICRNLPKLKLPIESVSFVIWIKGWQQLCPRDSLLRETFRVLKPGGRFVCFDVLPAAKTGNWLGKGSIKTLQEYSDLLLSTGFHDIRLADVTKESLGEHKKHMSGYLELRKLSGQIDDAQVQKVKTYFQEDNTLSQKALLISGCKESRVQGDTL